jgi:hypothetical protein
VAVPVHDVQVAPVADEGVGDALVAIEECQIKRNVTAIVQFIQFSRKLRVVFYDKHEDNIFSLMLDG